MKELFRMDRKNYNPEGKVYKRPSARAVILKEGKVLLNYVEKFDCYEFPGGGIEAEESPEQALIREVAEETGRVVIPESVREFGIVIRRQQDSKDPDGIRLAKALSEAADAGRSKPFVLCSVAHMVDEYEQIYNELTGN